MDNIQFYNSFCFSVISWKKDKHTDNSRGITRHFVARMRSGNGRIVAEGGEEMLVRAGDLFYLPRGLRYHSYWTPDKKGKTVEWESYGFDLFPCKSGRTYVMQKLNPPASALAHLDRIDARAGISVSAIGYFYAFMGETFPTMKRSDSDAQRELLSKARHYIHNHPDFKVPELARHCGMSESALYAFFRSYAGTTPIEEKNRILADRAISLLGSTDLSIEQISERIGFQSVAYFRKIVKEQTGKTPTEIRHEQLRKYNL